MKIPTILTFVRLGLIPVFVAVYYLPFEWSGIIAAVIFALAGITDLLDGYLARRLNQVTEFGAFLDPVVDKLMVVIALVLLAADLRMPYIALPAAIIISREIVVSALREWMAEIGEHASVAVNFVGKIKTTIQIIAIVGLLACDPRYHGFVFYTSYFFLYLAAVLTLWSMVMYLNAARVHFKLK